MKCFRILPDRWARTSCPSPSFTLKVAFGRESITVPSTGIMSSFGIQITSFRRNIKQSAPGSSRVAAKRSRYSSGYCPMRETVSTTLVVASLRFPLRLCEKLFGHVEEVLAKARRKMQRRKRASGLRRTVSMQLDVKWPRHIATTRTALPQPRTLEVEHDDVKMPQPIADPVQPKPMQTNMLQSEPERPKRVLDSKRLKFYSAHVINIRHQ